MLLKLLESGDVDLRITAGEAIALVYEGARDFDDEFTLANDSEGNYLLFFPVISQIEELLLKNLVTPRFYYFYQFKFSHSRTNQVYLTFFTGLKLHLYDSKLIRF